jgi:hypothetical protein
MKRLFVTIGIAACLVGFSSFKTPDVLASFFHTFKKAENVNWTEVDGMLRIGFTMNGSQRFAYYSDNELVVVATEIKQEELPAHLQSQLLKYSSYEVSQVYELESNNAKDYCVVLDNSSRHIVLKGKTKLRLSSETRK